MKETLDNLEMLVKERTNELETAFNLLKEIEKGLSEAQRISHIGSWDWNIVTDEASWSYETYRILELDPQEFSETYNSFLSNVHPEDRDYVDDAVKKALNGEPLIIDYRIILSNGKERDVHVESELIFDEKISILKLKNGAGYYRTQAIRGRARFYSTSASENPQSCCTSEQRPYHKLCQSCCSSVVDKLG